MNEDAQSEVMNKVPNMNTVTDESEVEADPSIEEGLVFESVPTHAGGHFVLGLYAAIFRLVGHVRQLSELGGSSLEEVFERYPFLAEYFLEMRDQMPEDLTWEDGAAWWHAAILQFEAQCFEAESSETPAPETPSLETPSLETPSLETPALETPAVKTPPLETGPATEQDPEPSKGAHLPLLSVDALYLASRAAGGAASEADSRAEAFAARLAFLLIGLVEEDSRFGTLFAEIQEPLPYRRPTLELVGQMMLDEVQAGQLDPWTLCGPLLASGLVEATDRERPRSEWCLRVPPILWDAARGRVQASPAPGLSTHGASSFPGPGELIQTPEVLERLAKVPALVEAGRVRSVVLRCDPGTDATEILGSVARQLGRGVLEVDVAAALAALPTVAAGVPSPEPPLARLGPLCSMARLMPVLRYELGPGETRETPPLLGFDGPLGLVLGAEGGLMGPALEASITFSLDVPRSELRRRFWLDAVASSSEAGASSSGEEMIEDLDTLCERFQLSGGYIRRVAKIAWAHAGLDGRQAIRCEDVRAASATLNRQLLDTLATHLDGRGSWSELVTAEATGDKLYELERRCRHRERLLDRLGPAFGSASNRGVRSLFLGASGTGKTLAARVLASELGMDLYRVDLAAVINKYIGETEKNLDRVLSRAEALDVVLLLDEGDALLGQRTEVKSSNDRYANLETNYLLQRLESYQGIVVVTTNLADNIDPAFQRRMDVVVPFFVPQAEERWRILGLHLPVDHTVDASFLEQVAVRCQLHGGQLRNAALHASLLALDEDGPVSNRHLEAAMRSEYRKAGGTCPLDTLPTVGMDSSLGVFAAALGGR